VTEHSTQSANLGNPHIAQRKNTHLAERRYSCSGGDVAAHRQRAEAAAAAETWRRTGSGRRQLQRQRRGGAQTASGGSCSSERRGPSNPRAGTVKCRTTKKQEGHRASEYQLSGRCARQTRNRQNHAPQGRIKPQRRRYVDSSPEKDGAGTDLHAGSSMANLQ
jgi:hypothetical protein